MSTKNSKKEDFEKIFITEFKKMMISGIQLKKFRKTFGSIKRKFIMNDTYDKLIWNGKDKENSYIHIKNISNIEKDGINITIQYKKEEDEKQLKIELYDENFADIFYDGIKLIKRELINQEIENKKKIESKRILQKILLELSSDSDTESETDKQIDKHIDNVSR